MPSKKSNVKKCVKNVVTIDETPSITFDSLANFQKLFVDSFMSYSNYLIESYKNDLVNDDYIHHLKRSWIVNFKTIFCPNWADLDLDSHPDLDTKENISSFFYRLSDEAKMSIPFDSYQKYEENQALFETMNESYFTAIFSDTFHTEFNALDKKCAHKDIYQRLSFYIPQLTQFFRAKNNNEFRNKIYNCALMMRVNSDSSAFAPANVIEECKYTYHMIYMIRSLRLFSQMKYCEAYDCVNLSNLSEYVNYVLIPLMGLMRSYIHIDYESDIYEFDSSYYYIEANSIPDESWIVASEDDYEEYIQEIRKRSEEAKQEEVRLKAIEDEEYARKMRNRVHSPPTINQRFVERLERQRTQKPERQSWFTITCEGEPIDRDRRQDAAPERVVVYKSESEIPNILRRRESNPSKEGETLLLFYYGTEDPMVYTKRILKTKIKGEMKAYSVQKLVSELPALLRIERNKLNFMRSSNIFFGRKVSEMNGFYRNQLYEIIISFCEEIASTHLEDNELRLSILQNYYGKKKESESIEQYFYNFRFDVFNSIAMYYCFYSSI
jgi:hypothetical protein